jgi:hypothetical protein
VQSVTCEKTRSYQTVACLLLDFADFCMFKGTYRSFFITQNSETLKTAKTSSPKLQKSSMKMKLCLSAGVNWTSHIEGSQFLVIAKTLIKPRSLEMSACSLDKYLTLKVGRLQCCLQDLSEQVTWPFTQCHRIWHYKIINFSQNSVITVHMSFVWFS